MKRFTLSTTSLLAISFLFAFSVTATPITPYSILLPNGFTGQVQAANDPGDVVGWFPGPFPPESLGFELEHQGNFTLIGPSFLPLTFGIRDNARALDINNRGDIIGLWNPFLTGEPGIFQSFLFSNGTYTNIEMTLPSSIPHCQDHETVVSSISDNGDIFGSFGFGDIALPCLPSSSIIRGTFL